MFIEVVKAEYIDGYRLLLLFNNGERRICRDAWTFSAPSAHVHGFAYHRMSDHWAGDSTATLN